MEFLEIRNVGKAVFASGLVANASNNTLSVCMQCSKRLVSYGGSAIVAMLFGFGLVINVHVHQSIGVGSATNLDLR